MTWVEGVRRQKPEVFEEESKSFWKQEDTVEYKFEVGCGSNCGP